MADNNPYTAVPSPSYAAPLINWQGLMNSQGQRPPQGQGQGAQPGAAPGGQPPSMAQQQMQGLGGRLMQMFGLNQPQGPQGQRPANPAQPGSQGQFNPAWQPQPQAGPPMPINPGWMPQGG